MLSHAGPVSAMSVRPLPLKSPVTTFAPAVAAQLAKSGAAPFVRVQVPSPLENALEELAHPVAPTRAMSVRPLPLKSPVTAFVPAVAAQLAKSGAAPFVTVQVPSPLEN